MIDTGIIAEFEVSGDTALFADPISKTGGEKFSLPFPSYGAVVGICKSVYFKRTFMWVPEKIRICNEIKRFSQGQKLPHFYGGDPDLADFTYLRNVRYQIRAHLVWNDNYPEMEEDRNARKHAEILGRALLRGGRRPVTLGPSECVAEVRPCHFGEGPGYYDNVSLCFGNMVHSMTWPDEGWDKDSRTSRITHYWSPTMVNGVIEFIRPEQCQIHKNLDATRREAEFL